MIKEGLTGVGKHMAAGTAGAKAVGAKTLCAKTLAVSKSALASPAFGILALAGIIAWELWRGKKDAQEIAAKKAGA